jgi:hypothetical protein
MEYIPGSCWPVQMEPLASVCFDDRAGQTFAPLLLPFHDRTLHIVNPEKKKFYKWKEELFFKERNKFHEINKNLNSYSLWAQREKNVFTCTADAPRSLRQGQVLKACWNLIDQLTPFITLSFLKSVTESTFSMLDTKYSSVRER